MTDAERLRRALRATPAPDEHGAEERAWRVVSALGRDGLDPRPRRARARSRALQAAVVLGLVAALASPAGASVRRWVAERIDPGVGRAEPVLGSLPGGGALLVHSREGSWVVHADGSKRLLGDFTEASWSPHGLFAVATTRRELAAVQPDGTVRWALARRGPVRLARWNGPDGYRIAYLDGRSLRVIGGNGEGDRQLARGVRPLAPAWKPGPDHVLAFEAASGAVRALDADTGAPLFEIPRGPGTISLQWTSGDLLVTRTDGLRLYDGKGRAVWRWSPPRRAPVRAAAIAPAGGRIAVVLRAGEASRLLLLRRGHPLRTLFAGPGRFGAPRWSPVGGWLLLPWPSADQWLFLRPGGRGTRLGAVANVAAQFAPGASLAPSFPRVGGWCCSR